MNIREIAKQARVSVATASRVINRNPTVAPQLARRVHKAVQELGYFPNTQARALVSGKSRILGLIVSEITNPFFPEVIQAFEDIAVQHNYEILLSSTAHDPKRMELSVRRMIERRVDGVAVVTFGTEDSLIADLRFRKVPLVFVDVALPVAGIGNIRVDYLHGIRQAVQHLAALRHTRIAFVSGPLHLRPAIARKDAFEQSMREIGLEASAGLVAGDHTIEGGMQALAELVGRPERPTAVLCSNDLTAIGVIREAYERGIPVPAGLSVVGFDDIPLSQFTIPPLTTVKLSQAELARLAFQALTDDANGAGEYLLLTNLVLRRSTSLAMAPGTE